MEGATTPFFGVGLCGIVAWLIGLVVAAFAISRAYETQRDYTIAYRYRRQLEELRRIKELGDKVKADDLGIMEDKPRTEPQPLGVWKFKIPKDID
jgi:hypothetical protein